MMYIKGVWNYERIMKLLFRSLNERNTTCFYCWKEIETGYITIDHLFPRAFGGVSIPDNMVIACKSCNKQKGNMSHHQYNRWLKYRKEERKDFYNKVIAEETKKYSEEKKHYNMPPLWVETVKVDQLKPVLPKKAKGNYIDNFLFIKTNGKLKRPLVISKNGFVLDGTNSFYAALELGFKEVPAVVLENVIFAK